MVEVFRVEDRCAETLGSREKCGVVVIDLVAAGDVETCPDIGFVDGHKRAGPQKDEPPVERSIGEQAFSAADRSEFGHDLPGNSEQ